MPEPHSRPTQAETPEPTSGSGVLAYGGIPTGRPIRQASVDLYGLKNPIPSEKEETERDRSSGSVYGTDVRFVPNLVHSNEVPVLLDVLEEVSTTHGACIASKTHYTLGKRFVVKPGRYADMIDFGDDAEEMSLSIADKDRAVLSELVKLCGPQGGLRDVFKLVCDEAQKQGNVWVELRRTKQGDASAFAIEVHSAQHVLRGVDQEGKLEDYVWVSRSWDSEYLRRFPAKKISLKEWEQDEEAGVERLMIHWMQRKTARRVYGVPSSLSGRLDSQNEFRSAEHNFWNFENGFSARTIMQFVKSQGMTDKKAKEFVARLREKFSGQSSERIFAQVVESEAMLARVDNIGDAFEGDFNELRDDSRKAVVRAHNWFEILIGNPTAGKLGQVQEFINTWKVAMATTIRPLRQSLMEGAIMPAIEQALLHLVGDGDRDWRLSIQEELPLSVFDGVDPEKIVGFQEAREHFGLSESDELPVSVVSSASYYTKKEEPEQPQPNG